MPSPVYHAHLEFAAADEDSVRQALDAVLQELGTDTAAPDAVEVKTESPLVVDPITGTIVVALIGLGGVLIDQIVKLAIHRDQMALEEHKLELEVARLPQDEKEKKAAHFLYERLQAVESQYDVTLTRFEWYDANSAPPNK